MADAVSSAVPARRRWQRAVPGVMVALVVGMVGVAIGSRMAVIGAPVVALVLGLVVGRATRRWSGAMAPGVRVSSTTLLQIAVVLLGTQMSLGEVARVGLGSLPVMLVTLGACLGVAVLAGRALGVEAELGTLVGVGTAICGAAAIAAVASVTRPRNTNVAYAVSTIFLFNVVAVLAFPPLGHLLGLSQEQFGLFAGTAVNDTSSVVATATAYGDQAAGHAVVVKLARTLMIVPICAVLATRFRTPAAGRRGLVRLVPWFLVGFLVMATLTTTGVMTPGVASAFKSAATLLTAAAMAAIGCASDPAALRSAGLRPLLLGTLLWITVATTSLLAQAVL